MTTSPARHPEPEPPERTEQRARARLHTPCARIGPGPGARAVYARVTLHEAMIGSYEVSGGNGDRAHAVEHWTLKASKIDLEYMGPAAPTREPASPPG